MSEVLNIAFNKGNSLDAQTLSNVALTPFEIDGVIWASVEAFWKALYHPEHERPMFREEFGISAWLIFRNREYPTSITYKKSEFKCDQKAIISLWREL